MTLCSCQRNETPFSWALTRCNWAPTLLLQACGTLEAATWLLRWSKSGLIWPWLRASCKQCTARLQSPQDKQPEIEKTRYGNRLESHAQARLTHRWSTKAASVGSVRSGEGVWWGVMHGSCPESWLARSRPREETRR